MSTATEPLTAAARLRTGGGSSSGLWFAILVTGPRVAEALGPGIAGPLEYTEARYIATGW